MSELDKIIEKIEKLENEIEEKKQRNKDTNKDEKKLKKLEDQFIKTAVNILILENETNELRIKLEELLIDIYTLEDALEALYSELAALDSLHGEIGQVQDKLKEMKKGKKKLDKDLESIAKKIKELEKIFKDKKKKRKGNKKESPEPVIETELVPLKLQGMSSTFGVIYVQVTDELNTKDPKEAAENCMLQYSMDGKTWYPVELDETPKDGFNFVYVATEPDKYSFRAAMGDWYGNIGFDDTSEVFSGNEPLEQLDPDISVVNVSFTYWYNGYDVHCVNQQQLIPQQNLANDVNSNAKSVSESILTPVSKTPYHRSLVTYQDGDDIIAVGYSETSDGISIPVRFLQGDSFPILESDIVTRNNIVNHIFLAIPPYDDAPGIILDTSLGIIETPNLGRNITVPGLTTTYIDSSMSFLYVDDSESMDWDYEISMRSNVSYFEDQSRNDNASQDQDSQGINETETEGELEIYINSDNETSENSFKDKLSKFTDKVKAKFNKWKARTKLGNKLKAGIAKFAGKFKSTWNKFKGKAGGLLGKFRDKVKLSFKGLKGKWLSNGKGLWGKFKSKYSNFDKGINSFFKGLLSKLDVNVTRKKGEEVKNFLGGWINKIKKKVGGVVNKVKGKFKKIKSNFGKKFSGLKSKFKNSFGFKKSFAKFGGKIKKDVEREIKISKSISGTGIKKIDSKIIGSWKSIGRLVRINDTDKDSQNESNDVNNSREQANNEISRVDSIRNPVITDEANNKKISYEIEDTYIDFVDPDAEETYKLTETIDIGNNLRPIDPVSIPPDTNARAVEPSETADDFRYTIITYTLEENSYSDLLKEENLNGFYDSSALDFEIVDESIEALDWVSDEMPAVGSLAFVAFGRLGVRAVDLSDPENPDIRVEGSFEQENEVKQTCYTEHRIPNETAEETTIATVLLNPTDDVKVDNVTFPDERRRGFDNENSSDNDQEFFRNVNQSFLDNLTSELTLDMNYNYEYFQELENATGPSDYPDEELYEKGRSYVKTILAKGRSWLKKGINKGSGYVNKGRSWVNNKVDKGKSWANGYVNKAKGYINKGKSLIKGMYDKGKDWANNYIGKAKGWVNKSKSWVNDKIDYGKSLLINNTNNSDDPNERTTNTRTISEASKARVDTMARDLDVPTLRTISRFKSDTELSTGSHIFIAKGYHRDGFDGERYINAANQKNDTDKTDMSYSTTHYQTYNSVGQIESETIFNHETEEVSYGWWGHCNGWVSSSVLEREPVSNISGYRPFISGQLNTIITLTTDFQPGFYVPDLKIDSTKIDDPEPRDKILDNESNENSPLILNGIIRGHLSDNYQVDFTGELTVEEDFIYQASDRVKATLVKGGKVTAQVEQSKFKEATLDLTVLADITIKGQVLKLKGTVDGKIDSDHTVDVEGTITVREDFKYKKGKVTATLKKGGSLGVKVKKNEFKWANLSGLRVQVDVEIGEKELELQGSIGGGKYEGKNAIELYGSLTIRKTYNYKKDNVSATQSSGGSVTVEVKASKLVRVDFSVNFEVETGIESDIISALKINGSIHGTYKPNGSFDLTGSLTLVPPFQYKKGKLTVDLKSSSFGVDVKQSQFKKTEFNVISEVGISYGDINDTDLKLQGSMVGKYGNDGSETQNNTDDGSNYDYYGRLTSQISRTSRNYESDVDDFEEKDFTYHSSFSTYMENIICYTNNNTVSSPNRPGSAGRSTYSILHWHMEQFDFPTLDPKNNSNLIQTDMFSVENLLKVCIINNTPGSYYPDNDNITPRMTKGDLIEYVFKSKGVASFSKKDVVPDNDSDMTKEDLINQFNVSLKTGYLIGPVSVVNSILGYSGGSVLGGSNTGGSNFMIDSFFDLYVDIDDNNSNSAISLTVLQRIELSNLSVRNLRKGEAGTERPSQQTQVKMNSGLSIITGTDWGVGQSPFIVDSFFDVYVELDNGQDLDDSGNVMGVEPSPFHIDSFFDVWLYTNSLFPSGPAKGAAFYSGITIELDRTGQVSGLGESPFHSGFSFESSSAIIIPDGSNVSGVEPSPFRYASSFSMQTIIAQSEPGGHVTGRNHSAYFESISDTFGGNSGSGVWQSLYIEQSLSMNISKIRNRTGDDWGVGQSPFIVDSFFDVFVDIESSNSTDDDADCGDSFLEINVRSSIQIGREYCDIHNTSNCTDPDYSVPNVLIQMEMGILSDFGDGVGGRADSYGLHWSSIVNFDAWDWRNDPDRLFPSGPAKGAGNISVDVNSMFPSGPAKGYGNRYEIEVDLNMISELGVVSERKNTSDVDNDGKLDTGNDSSSWHHVSLSFKHGIRLSNVDGEIDGNNSIEGDSLSAHDGFSIASYFSSSLTLGNPLPSKFDRGNDSSSVANNTTFRSLFKVKTRTEINVMFNPAELSVKKTVPWNETEKPRNYSKGKNSNSGPNTDPNTRQNSSSSRNNTAQRKIAYRSEYSEELEVMFNPKEYVFTKSVAWSEYHYMGSDHPMTQFTSGGSYAFKTGIIFSKDNNSGLDKWVKINRNYTSYYDNSFSLGENSGTTIGGGTQEVDFDIKISVFEDDSVVPLDIGGNRINNSVWSRVTSSSWVRVSSGAWGSISGTMWNSISGGFWGGISSATWSTISSTMWGSVSGTMWNSVSSTFWNTISSDTGIRFNISSETAVRIRLNQSGRICREARTNNSDCTVDDNSSGDSSDISYSSYEIYNLRATLDGVTNQMELIQSFSYSGIEMQKNDCTIANDKYSTESCYADTFVIINMSSKLNLLLNESRNGNTITVAGFDVYHRLTRGTNSRTWGDGHDNNDNLSDPSSVFWVDSFFDITYEIPTETENENDSVRTSIRQSISIKLPGSYDNRDLHPDFYWMEAVIEGYGESGDDLNDNDNSYMNYTRFRMVRIMKMNFIYLFGDNESEIEMHADFMTKAELIGAVAGGINDSADEQTQRSGDANGSKPPSIDHLLYFKSEFSFKIVHEEHNRWFYWHASEFISNVVDDYNSSNRSAHPNYSATFQLVNGSSDRVICSSWREFDNSRRFKIGIETFSSFGFIDSATNYQHVNGSSSYSIFSKWSEVGPTSNFKIEIEGVDAGQFTSADLNITQEVINYNDHETFWCRVSSTMVSSSGRNNSLPEVDDEVIVGLGQTFNTGNEPGLHDYSINFLLENLSAGKKPAYKIDTKYNYTGNNNYYGNVSYTVRTINNNSLNMTYVYLKVDTYEKTVDENGNTIKKLLFTDVFKVKYETINVDSKSGSANLKEVIEVVVERWEYK